MTRPRVNNYDFHFSYANSLCLLNPRTFYNFFPNHPSAFGMSNVFTFSSSKEVCQTDRFSFDKLLSKKIDFRSKSRTFTQYFPRLGTMYLYRSARSCFSKYCTNISKYFLHFMCLKKILFSLASVPYNNKFHRLVKASNDNSSYLLSIAHVSI